MIDCELDAAFAIYWRVPPERRASLDDSGVIEWAREHEPEKLARLTLLFEQACLEVLG